MTRARIYTFEVCQELAKIHPTRSKLNKAVPNAYTAARRAGWLDLLYPPENRPQQPEPWTKKRVAEVSKLYASRSEMHRSPHQWALKVAQKNKWFDVLPPELCKPNGYWTEERIQACVDKCKTIKEFRENYSDAYSAAKKLNYKYNLPAAPSTPLVRKIKWTLAVCKADALQYASRGAWQKNSSSAYQIALRNGWLTECCTHMIDLRNFWTREEIARVAQECTSGNHMREKYPGAYDAAKRNGLGELIPYANESTNDNDTFYLWQAKETFYNGLPVYKFGITSERLEKKRIRDVAKAAGLKAEVLLYVPLEQAPGIERIAASLGQDPVFDRFDGYTEFRAYTQHDIAEILAALQQAGVPII